MRAKIPGFSVFLLIVASVGSIRNLPSAAIFGPSMIFFYVIAAAMFLIPLSLICAELAAASTNEGGLYHWVRKAFGEKWGVTAAWLHWINTVVWFPSFLSFVAATIAFLFYPEFANDKVYLVSSILVMVWVVTCLSLLGIHISSRVADICVLAGTVFPILLIIGLGVIWLMSERPVWIDLTHESMIPSTLFEKEHWISLVAIMASFMGVELAGVHVKEIAQPKLNFHRAVLFASAFILFSMIFGSLVVAMILPQNEISLISGVMQTFEQLFHAFGWQRFLPEITFLVLIGSVGSLIHWSISPAASLLEAAEHGYIPHIFAKKNSYGAHPYMMLTQAVVVSLFCLLLFLEPTINSFYWFLLALSTAMSMLVYLLVLFSALVLRYNRRKEPETFTVPGRKFGLWVAVIFGALSSLTTIVMSFFPPTEVIIESPGLYTIMIAGGILVLLIPIFFFLRRKEKS